MLLADESLRRVAQRWEVVRPPLEVVELLVLLLLVEDELPYSIIPPRPMLGEEVPEAEEDLLLLVLLQLRLGLVGQEVGRVELHAVAGNRDIEGVLGGEVPIGNT